MVHEFLIIVWEVRNEGLTKLKNRPSSDGFCYFQPPSLTSNSSLSFEASDLKVWFQTASTFGKNAPFRFFIFCLGAEK